MLNVLASQFVFTFKSIEQRPLARVLQK